MSVDRLSTLTFEHRNQLESMLMEFDSGWAPSKLKKFLEKLASNKINDQLRDAAVVELVKVDLQRRWASGQGKLIEEYFPMLPRLEALVDAGLVLVELIERRRVENEVSIESYAKRFPEIYPEIAYVALENQFFDIEDHEATVLRGQASIETSRMGRANETIAPTGGKETQLPSRFGRYKIEKQLGSGAMGTVYLAKDTQLDRNVALKIPNLQSDENDELVQRFYVEARATAKIQHRNICPVFDVGQIEGRHFISMAFIKGRPLSQFINAEKLPPEKTSAILIHRLAMALAEAHRHNVVHRDLKPANIMIDTQREPVVMDFGLARQTDVEVRMTQSGALLGTPAYMSPEQLNGEAANVGQQSDIFSLGVIFYELLTGKLPFDGTLAQVVCQILQEDPTPPSELRESVSPGLEAICNKMLEKDPGKRFATMTDVATAIKTQLNEAKSISSGMQAAASSRETDKPLKEYFGAMDVESRSRSGSEKRAESVPKAVPVRKAVPVKDINSAKEKATADSNGVTSQSKRIALVSILGVATTLLIAFGIFKMMNTTETSQNPDPAKQNGTSSIRGLDQEEPNQQDDDRARTNSKAADNTESTNEKTKTESDSSSTQDPESPDFFPVNPRVTESKLPDQMETSPSEPYFPTGISETKEPSVAESSSTNTNPNETSNGTAPPKLVENTGAAFKKIFNGRNLDGWSQHASDLTKQPNDRAWKVTRDKELLVDGNDWTWLFTDRKYRDFVLKFEYRIEQGENQLGVIFRGGAPHELPLKGLESWQKQMTSSARKAIQARGKRIVLDYVGIQVQLKTAEIQSYGTSMDHERKVEKKWFNRLMRAQPLNKPNLRILPEWNQFEAICQNDRLTVVVNGEVVNVVTGLSHVEGKIGLKQEQTAGQFRNIEILELKRSDPTRIVAESAAADEKWTTMFNGQNFRDWQVSGGDGFSIADNAIVANAHKKKEGWLLHDLEMEDFELELEYWLSNAANSGIAFRAWPGGSVSKGDFYEIQLLDDTAKKYSKIPKNQKTGSLFARTAPSPFPKPKPNHWHKLKIRVHGDRVQVWIGPNQILNSKLGPVNKAGKQIGLQVFSGQAKFRNIRIKKSK